MDGGPIHVCLACEKVFSWHENGVVLKEIISFLQKEERCVTGESM